MVKHWLSNMFDPAGSRVYGPPASLTAGSNVRTGTSMPVRGPYYGTPPRGGAEAKVGFFVQNVGHRVKLAMLRQREEFPMLALPAF